ncbi:MAG: hypothetical protein AAF391_01475 [Bacteroidota bacterium]
MKKFKIALVHCPKSTIYKLVKMTSDMNENDPCIMWIFDSSKLKVAKKILLNMNAAKFINASDDLSMIS